MAVDGILKIVGHTNPDMEMCNWLAFSENNERIKLRLQHIFLVDQSQQGLFLGQNK